MWTKEEKKNYNNLFWNDFKKKMNKNKSSEGRFIQWLHYPTEIKYFYLRLITENNHVSVCFDIQNKSEAITEVFLEQIIELKSVINNIMGQEFNIFTSKNFHNQNLLRIEWKKDNLNYLNPEDKEKIFNFFEETLINFDIFYQEYKEIFIFLAK